MLVCEYVKSSSEFYNPKGRPWIKQESASIETLKYQIDMYPSLTLSYRQS